MPPKILAILGPTSSGKSDLAVRLAKKLNGEVVSADSRQVYKGLDIGTGKITRREMRGVPHHLLDVASAKRRFSVSEFKKDAEATIDKILDKGRLPIICGGTGFYIQAIVDNVVLPDVPPNPKLRNKLEQRSVSQLFSMLKKLDAERAKNIDSKNPRRLIRAIEIATSLGKVPKIKSRPKYQALQIGINLPDSELKKHIDARLQKRLRQGMINEARKLHRSGLSWKRMHELGLEYRYLAEYLQGRMSKAEMIERIRLENWHYAKRQRQWFKRDRRIIWI